MNKYVGVLVFSNNMTEVLLEDANSTMLSYLSTNVDECCGASATATELIEKSLGIQQTDARWYRLYDLTHFSSGDIISVYACVLQSEFSEALLYNDRCYCVSVNSTILDSLWKPVDTAAKYAIEKAMKVVCNAEDRI